MSPSGPREERARTPSSAPVLAAAGHELLGRPPQIAVELVREVGRSRAGFLEVREVELRNRYDDGATSAPYHYFLIERHYLDAVALVLYRRVGETAEVVLRSQLRPPLAFREQYEVPLLALGTGAVQWEIPAGLVEPGECGEAGLFARARAEALEEVGVALPLDRFELLGVAASLSPGLIAEKLHFVCAEVRADDALEAPTGDGHAVEERSTSVFVALRSALDAIDRGLVHDVKTEVGIRRLAARMGALR